jgi:hypothetical protein
MVKHFTICGKGMDWCGTVRSGEVGCVAVRSGGVRRGKVRYGFCRQLLWTWSGVVVLGLARYGAAGCGLERPGKVR